MLHVLTEWDTIQNQRAGMQVVDVVNVVAVVDVSSGHFYDISTLSTSLYVFSTVSKLFDFQTASATATVHNVCHRTASPNTIRYSAVPYRQCCTTCMTVFEFGTVLFVRRSSRIMRFG